MLYLHYRGFWWYSEVFHTHHMKLEFTRGLSYFFYPIRINAAYNFCFFFSGLLQYVIAYIWFTLLRKPTLFFTYKRFTEFSDTISHYPTIHLPNYCILIRLTRLQFLQSILLPSTLYSGKITAFVGSSGTWSLFPASILYTLQTHCFASTLHYLIYYKKDMFLITLLWQWIVSSLVSILLSFYSSFPFHKLCGVRTG